MKKMKYKTWLFAFLVCANVYANGNLDDSVNFPPCSGVSRKMTSERTLSGKEVFIPHAAQGVQVKFVSGEFYAEKNGASKLVQRANLSKELRGITSEQLDGFLKVGYVALKPFGEDDYSLNGKVRIKGGMNPTQEQESKSGIQEIVTTVWTYGNHRTGQQWLNQQGHRSPSEWWKQGNHRSVFEWLSGVPSRNK